MNTRCFIQPCDEKPTKLVIIETDTLTVKMPMCPAHLESDGPAGLGDPKEGAKPTDATEA